MAEVSQLEELLEELKDTNESNQYKRNELLDQISQFSVSELRESSELLMEILNGCLAQSETALKATQIYTDYLSVLDGKDKANAEDCLRLIVQNLGDTDPQTRKYSHMFLLCWVKKYNDLNSVIRAFLTAGFCSQSSTIKQKSINSFQGIILTEARIIDWSSKDIFRVIGELLTIWQKEVHTNVQKAADHALVSLCKRDEMRIAVTKLDIQQMKIIKQIAEKHFILGLLPEEIENSSIILTQHKKDHPQNQQSTNQTLGNTINSQMNSQQSQQNTNKSDQIFTDLLNQPTRNNRLLPQKRINKDDQDDEEMEDQQIRQKNISSNTVSSTHKFTTNSKEPGYRTGMKGYEVKSEGYILQTDQNLKLHFGLLSQKQYNDLQSQKDWRAKAQTVEELEKYIEESDDLTGVEDEIEQFLDLILDLTSDTNFKVQVTSMNIVYAIIGLKKCADENVFRTISSSIIDKLGDSKIAIRQLAQKIILKHFENFDYHGWIDVIVQNLKQKSAQLKEDSLGILDILIKEYNTKHYSNENGENDEDSINSDDNSLGQNSRLAKQQKRNVKKAKKINFDWKYIVKELSSLLDDPKDKIRSKCLDCFIQINTTLKDSEQFTEYLQQILTKDQQLKVFRATGNLTQNQIQNRLEKSGNQSRGVDYSNYQYMDQDGNMHFSFANVKKGDDNSYLPSSANPNSLNRSINRQFIQSPEIQRKTIGQSKNITSNNDFKIHPYNMLDSKGGRYCSNLPSNSVIEDASTSVGSSIQQTTPNQNDSIKNNQLDSVKLNQLDSLKQKYPDSIKKAPIKKSSYNETGQDSLDYLNPPFDKRPLQIGSAGKIQKSTFEVALEQQAIVDKRINSAVNPERNQYNDVQQNSIVSPQLKKTLKSSLNGGDGSNYTNEEDLEPLRNADNAVSTVLTELKCGDWDRQFQALDTVRRLIKFHHETLTRSTHFQNILKEVNLLIDNLRSSLAKNAMMTISEMSLKLKKHVEVQIDGTFSKLMKKGLDANAFILEEVKKALTSVCTNCAPQKILTNCFSLNLKSPQTKQYLLQCFDTLILVHQEKLSQVRDFDKIVENIGNLTVDSSQEVRNSAKSALYNLSINCIDKSKIKSILARTKDETTLNKIMSSIDSVSRGGLDSTMGATGRTTCSINGKNSKYSVTQKSSKGNMNTGTLYSQQNQFSNNNLDFLDTYSNIEQINNISPENIRITKAQSQQQPPNFIPPKPAKSTSISRIQRSPGVFDSNPNYVSSAQNNGKIMMILEEKNMMVSDYKMMDLEKFVMEFCKLNIFFC